MKRKLGPFNLLGELLAKTDDPTQRELLLRAFHRCLDEYIRATPTIDLCRECEAMRGAYERGRQSITASTRGKRNARGARRFEFLGGKLAPLLAEEIADEMERELPTPGGVVEDPPPKGGTP